MTILPKKKGPKERAEGTTSRGHSHGPPSPLVPQQIADSAVAYNLLTDPLVSNQNRAESGLEFYQSSHQQPGTSRSSPLAPHSSSGLCKPSVSHLATRNKKQKCYSDDEDEQTNGDRLRASGQQQDEEERNSDDESEARIAITAEELIQKETAFSKLLQEKRKLVIKPMKEDGACLFRAVADQVMGDEEMHDMVRQQCLDYMERNEDYFSQYITEDFQQYIRRKRTLTEHGNHIEIQAMSEVYNRRIEVFEYDIDPINVFQGAHPQENAPVRVSYHQKCHYNSVIDPYAATIGVGLGMPDFHPGLAEQRLMSQAIGQSEEEASIIEKQMLQDKMSATDWEATNEAIEQQIAQESYLEWLKQSEKDTRRTGEGAPSTSSSSLPSSAVRQGSPNPSTSSPTSMRLVDQLNHLPPAIFGLSDWEEEDGNVLAQVLASSQAEYLESLKRDQNANR
ncbi:hypothetical protein RvY_05420 [Ramazzottius varieornatus]|uniref:ubiquitinyl hydrolase 1 n=1 Tax=Ramazzottius varieornatus TaxID=947166 RepID=A0A1D1UYL4_RAMVA|nr:hypothetical protein RvY_05420 [Ramazzottius varieornatus]